MSKISKTDIYKLKKGDAIDLLKKLDLSTTGARPDLLKRIHKHFYGEKVEKDKPIESTSSKKESTPSEKESTSTNSTTNSASTPSKSDLRLMSKSKLIDLLSSLNLPTKGVKNDLVSRLELYYRPYGKESQNPSNNSFDNVPSKTELRKMNKDLLIKRLKFLNLSINGSRLELFNRLEIFYRPNENNSNSNYKNVDDFINTDDSDTDESDTKEYSVTLRNLTYLGFSIGICDDTNRIYEHEPDKDEWYRTQLFWDWETCTPKGYYDLK